MRFISITFSITKFDIYIIIILVNFYAEYNNSGLNKLFIIKEFIAILN